MPGSPEQIPMIQAPFNSSCDSVALYNEAGKNFSMKQFPSYVLLKLWKFSISPYRDIYTQQFSRLYKDI